MIYENILQNLLNKYEIINNKKIIVFGTGYGGTVTAFILKNLSLKLDFFVDNDNKKWDKYFWGCIIKNPSDLKNLYYKDIIILICSEHYQEIGKQLDEMKFEKDINYYYILDNDKKYSIKDCGRYEFSVGKYTYGYEQFCYHGVKLQSIGSFCSIAPNVSIAQFNHPVDKISTHPFFYLSNRGFIEEDKLEILNNPRNDKVVIGNDVWIGTNVTILPGVKIGNGAVTGAGALVSKDIPDYGIAVGVPAKTIKYRFSEEEINLLNQSKWWDWSDEKIARNMELFTENKLFFEYAKEYRKRK